MASFYDKRAFAPLWVSDSGATPGAQALARELADAASYGLDPSLLAIPDLSVEPAQLELALTTATLTYARHARGGRIPDPAGMLNSNLDRKPQLIAANVVLGTLRRRPSRMRILRGLQP